MIRYIKGTFSLAIENGIVIETQSGIGFKVFVPVGSPIYSHNIGDEIICYTEMVVKEDDISLYGFHNIDSLNFFNLLTTVNGIGPKGAMSILGSMPLDDIKRAIAFGDISLISKANGVGKKTAERLVLELKDKIGLENNIEGSGMKSLVSASFSSEKQEAISALISLGYSKQEASSAISKISEENLKSEEYIKRALKNLL